MLSGQLQLSAARQQLSAGKQQYEAGMALLKEQKKTGAQELADAKDGTRQLPLKGKPTMFQTIIYLSVSLDICVFLRDNIR